MTRLLYIESSPHGAASHSGAAAREFLHAFTARHPRTEVDHVDVWNLELPPFDAEMIAAKFAVLRAKDATPAQQARWSEAVRLARRFNRADLYLFSLPMWNFGLPYRLKHFIDVITLPGQNWNWSRETGYRPLLAGKRAVLVYSSAGTYHRTPSPASRIWITRNPTCANGCVLSALIWLARSRLHPH